MSNTQETLGELIRYGLRLRNDIGSVFERSENMEHAVVLPQQSN